MNAERFNNFTRHLLAATSRRGVLAGVMSGLLPTVPIAFGSIESEAKRKKKKKRNKKKNRFGSPTPSVPVPPAPTCTDGIKNGGETDVDCGGACPPCVNGQGCASRNDCEGALCSNGACQACSVTPDTCGPDCFCVPQPSGSPICADMTKVTTVMTCADCPAGTVFCRVIIDAACFPRCAT